MKRQRAPKRPLPEGPELYRTEKGRVELDLDTAVFRIWLRRDDGTELELEELQTRDFDTAVAVLKDTPAPGPKPKR